jgi:hypothetical protein
MMVEASFLFGDATYTIKLNIEVTVYEDDLNEVVCRVEKLFGKDKGS